jgi:hypothetical protein
MSVKYLQTVADAQRKAFQILKHATPSCKQDVVLHRPDIKSLTFEIQDGIESISKLTLIRRNEMSVIPRPFHSVIFKMTGYKNDICFDYADFHLDMDGSVIMNLEPFPIFMFPNFKFKITILPDRPANPETNENIIMDYDIVAETIIHTREVLDDIKLSLSKFSDNPGNYKFVSKELNRFYPTSEINMQKFTINPFMVGGTTFYPSNVVNKHSEQDTKLQREREILLDQREARVKHLEQIDIFDKRLNTIFTTGLSALFIYLLLR